MATRSKTPITPDLTALAAAQAAHEESKHLPAVVDNKPMNQTQLKNLQKLVDIDFNELHSQVIGDIHLRASKRKEQIEAAHSAKDPGLSKMQKKVAAWEEKVRTDAGALQAEMNESGFGLPNGAVLHIPSPASYSIVRLNKNEELLRVRRAESRLTEIASNLMGREKRKIDRVILLQGITGAGAQSIIDDMPELRDIFALVQAEMQNHEDDVVELLGDVDDA